MKWAALLAEPLLPKPARCMHLRGHGGSVVSVAEVREALASGEYTFVYRTDIRGYYRHIRKQQVINQLEWRVADPVLFDVIQQYVHYSVEDGGEFYTPPSGICRGCALSPLIGGSLLHHVDSFFNAQEGVWYARYMDDFLLFTRTRWQLRRCVNGCMNFLTWAGLKLTQTKPNWAGLHRVLTGWGYGLPPRGPP